MAESKLNLNPVDQNHLMDLDSVTGSKGDDILKDMGSKSDKLYGDEGSDVLISTGGDDTLNGGQGYDTYVIHSNSQPSQIIDIKDLGINKLTLDGKPMEMVIDHDKVLLDGNLLKKETTSFNGTNVFIFQKNSLTLLITPCPPGQEKNSGYNNTWGLAAKNEQPVILNPLLNAMSTQQPIDQRAVLDLVYAKLQLQADLKKEATI